jgi:hypothetical protein
MPIDSNLGPVISHGNEFNNPVIQEGATLNEDGMGLRVLNGTLLVKDTDSSSTLSGSNLPKIGDEIIKGSGLFIAKIAKRYKWTGQIACDFEAIGIDPAYNGITDVTVEGSGTTSSEPIESHWNFENIGGTPTARKNGAQFDPQTGKFLGFSTDTKGTTVTSVGQPLAGVRSYLAPRGSFRCYFHCGWAGGNNAEVFANLQRQLGTQSRDGNFSGIKTLPAWIPRPNSNYLLTSINAENLVCPKGAPPKIVKISYEIVPGGSNGGWNNLIYRDWGNE